MLCRAALITATLVLAVAAAPEPRPLKVRLYPMPGSLERGTATIAQRGTDLIVSVVVVGQHGTLAQYAHLHKGTCERIAAPTVYELNPVRGGHSTTRLANMDMERFTRGMYSILIHKTSSRSSAHVACGTIAGA